MSGCGIDSPSSKKINGYDKWDVERDAEKLIEAKKLENGDQKYYKTLVIEVKKIADAAMEAAAQKQLAASEVSLTKKVSKKMKKIYGG
jgi:hypothetical protein